MAIEWSKALECGDVEIDNAKKQLVDIINVIMRVSTDKQHITFNKILVAGLSKSLGRLFFKEERLMQRHGYRDAREHGIQHRDILDAIDDYAGGETGIILQTRSPTITIIIGSLISHIESMDRPFAQFIQSRRKSYQSP